MPTSGTGSSSQVKAARRWVAGKVAFVTTRCVALRFVPRREVVRCRLTFDPPNRPSTPRTLSLRLPNPFSPTPLAASSLTTKRSTRNMSPTSSSTASPRSLRPRSSLASRTPSPARSAARAPFASRASTPRPTSSTRTPPSSTSASAGRPAESWASVECRSTSLPPSDPLPEPREAPTRWFFT